MRKFLSFHILGFFLVLSLCMACSEPDSTEEDEKDKPAVMDQQNASTLGSDVFLAYSEAQAAAASSISPSIRALSIPDVTIDITTTGGIGLKGTIKVSPSVSMTMDMTFTNFISKSGYTLNGTAHFDYAIIAGSDYHVDYTGTIKLDGNGFSNEDVTWDIDVDKTSTGMTISGSVAGYTINFSG